MLPILKPQDLVEIIAPASRCTEKVLQDLKSLLESWGLHCFISDDLFGDDLLCANSDTQRLKSLKKALTHPETKAIICARGGYGSLRLIPELYELKPPKEPKLFLGMSDITALHLFLESQWHWPTVHGALAQDKFSQESIAATKALLFGQKGLSLAGTPLNTLAEKEHHLETSLTGGNLTLVQTSIGTPWRMNAQNKIIFLEEVGERGYRIDRMLEHLQQAGILQHASAICFGDFIDGNEPNGTSLLQPVLERFAQNCPIPVVQIPGIGHGPTNYPLPLGVNVKLQLGKTVTLHY